MTTYNIDFKSGGLESTPSIPGKTSISLPKNTVNTTSTTLALTGQGTPLYGEYQQENFIRLLEHFASKNGPQHPTIGQIWFDTGINRLKVYDMTSTWVEISSGLYFDTVEPGIATEGQLWYHTVENILYLKINPDGPYSGAPRYFGGTWVQVYPHIVRYAAAAEYNALAARINKVIGTVQTTGIDADVANNQWGWGETDVLPIFVNNNNPRPFDNRAWLILLSRLMKATRHIDNTLSPIANVTQYGFVSDGRGDDEATAELYTPSKTWVYGWGSAGIVTVGTRYTAITTAVQALEDNRFTMDTLDTTWTILDTVVRPSWKSTKVYNASVQFTTEAAAKRFFNSGGLLRFNISNQDGFTALNTAWRSLLTNASTNVNDYTTAGFVIDYKGCKLGPAGTYISGASSKGYYDLTTSYQTLQTVNRGGAYGTGSLTFEAKTSTSGGWTVDVQITFTETFVGGDPTVDGTTTVVLQVRHPTGVVAGDPTISTPVIVTPSATTSGTFKTAPAE